MDKIEAAEASGTQQRMVRMLVDINEIYYNIGMRLDEVLGVVVVLREEAVIVRGLERMMVFHKYYAWVATET